MNVGDHVYPDVRAVVRQLPVSLFATVVAAVLLASLLGDGAVFAEHMPPLDVHKFGSIIAITDEADGYTKLNGAASITTTKIGDRHYALVASMSDHGVQIIDITNPTRPSPVAAITDNTDGYTELDAAYSIDTAQIGNGHYALVAAYFDHGVQIIDITNPTRPSPVAAITDNTDGYTELDAAYSIDTAQIGNGHYALVAAYFDHGVQIIDITNPTRPSPVAAITDNTDGYTELDGAASITTTKIGNRHYALVAAYGDNGVQIIDITNPASPSPIAAFNGNTDGYTELDGAYGIDTAQIGNRHYALVASYSDKGIQTIDITDPANPSPAANLAYGTDEYTVLSGPRTVTTAEIDSRHYALVTLFANDGIQIIRTGLTTGLILAGTDLIIDGTEYGLKLAAENDSSTFEVQLAVIPPSDVIVNLVAAHCPSCHPHGDASAATVTPKNLTFTTTNWNVRQTVTVTGVPDSDDGDEHLIILLIPSRHYLDMGLHLTGVYVTVADGSNTDLTVEARQAETVLEQEPDAPEQEQPVLMNGTHVPVPLEQEQEAQEQQDTTVLEQEPDAPEQQDTTAPVITLAGSSIMTIQVNSIYDEPGYMAIDDYGGNLTGSVTVTGTVDTTRTGTYMIYYDVTDGSGNAAVQKTRTVHVEPVSDPQARLPDVVERYDIDNNGSIDQQEWERAIDDYENYLLTNEEISAISMARSYR